MVGPGGGSQGWPAKAVQMERSRPRSEVSVGTVSLLLCERVYDPEAIIVLFRTEVFGVDRIAAESPG